MESALTPHEILFKASQSLNLPLHSYLDALLIFNYCSLQFQNQSLLSSCIYLSTKMNELQLIRIRDIINAVLIAKLEHTDNLAFIAN